MSIIQDTSMDSRLRQELPLQLGRVVKEELAKLLDRTGAGDKKGKRK